LNYVTVPLEEPPTKAALNLSEDKAAKAHAEALATARAENKTAVAAKGEWWNLSQLQQQKIEAAKKA